MGCFQHFRRHFNAVTERIFLCPFFNRHQTVCVGNPIAHLHQPVIIVERMQSHKFGRLFIVFDIAEKHALTFFETVKPIKRKRMHQTRACHVFIFVFQHFVSHNTVKTLQILFTDFADIMQ